MTAIETANISDPEWDEIEAGILTTFADWGKAQRQAMLAAGETRNSAELRSFVAFCIERPQLRFFQALSHWMGWPYVLVAAGHPNQESYQASDLPYNLESLQDTYGWEVRQAILNGS